MAARRRASVEKIKVAVLDSGADMNHQLLAPHRSRIREVKDWIDRPDDQVSRGTCVTALVLSIAPNAEIYVAKVFESTRSTVHTKRYVSEVSLHLFGNKFRPLSRQLTMQQKVGTCTQSRCHLDSRIWTPASGIQSLLPIAGHCHLRCNLEQ